MDVGGDWLYVVLLHKGFLMVAAKEPHLDLPVTVLLSAEHFCRPVGEAFLLGVHNLMERSTRLGKPMPVPRACFRVSVAVSTSAQITKVIDAISEH